MERKEKPVSTPIASVRRMPGYLRCLRAKREDGVEFISSVTLAACVGLNAVVVKKDLALVSGVAGKPKIGFAVKRLIADVERFLGYDNVTDAVLVGAGQLGRTLLSYEGFKNYGLNIVAAFDVNEELIGTGVNGKRIFGVDKLANLVGRMGVHLGIITTPKEAAQRACDLLVGAGIKAVWNFAPAHIKVPDGVVVRNEDMAASLAVLSNQLRNIQINATEVKTK
ncbi:MAG: redox-sensing transcriptional repressor Rex [Clostridiales bacterium]|jgi:redox-sensing transcriptional repressor|nr:redox-sensing transcriptional repressor Rex [Clostridiales bacterium]